MEISPIKEGSRLYLTNPYSFNLKQDTKCTHSEMLWHVRANTVVVENKEVLNTVSVSL